MSFSQTRSPMRRNTRYGIRHALDTTGYRIPLISSFPVIREVR